MKNILLLSAVLFGLSAFAQENKEVKDHHLFAYSCRDSVSLNKDKTIVQLFGDVSFKTDSLEISHADKIVFNKETNEMVVTGKFIYRLFGTLQLKIGAQNNTFKYKIGDNTAYVD